MTDTIGISLKAKRLGLISSVKEEIEKIRNTGFRISEETENGILRLTGEA